MINRKSINSIRLIQFLIVLQFGCTKNNSYDLTAYRQHDNTQQVVESAGNTEIAVERPPLSAGIFPCNDCHSVIEPEPDRRELIYNHEDIGEIFDHDNENRWCLDCHDTDNRDFLKLASGKLLDFQESYKLCGQCHGEKLRDWKVGVHGKRTGEWNGKKEYLLCVHCHDPHTPKFKELTPEPPPVMQEHIK